MDFQIGNCDRRDGPPAPTLAPRRKTRQLMVGDVGVGSDASDLGAVDVHHQDP
jgi:hypothetical protein